jgi:hypothetical protein
MKSKNLEERGLGVSRTFAVVRGPQQEGLLYGKNINCLRRQKSIQIISIRGLYVGIGVNASVDNPQN